MINVDNIPSNIKLIHNYYSKNNEFIKYNKLFNFVTEYIILYDEQLDKYNEKRLFKIVVDYNNKNIYIYSFDKLLCLLIKNNKDIKLKIYGHKYIDNYDKIDHNQCEDFILDLIQSINKNFNNIIYTK